MPSSKVNKRKNPHRGSSLDSFLREEGILEEIELAALKRAVAMKLADLMQKKQASKSSVAETMGTSRAALDRLLDPERTSVTLNTLAKAAKALGRRVKIDFVPA